MTGKYQVGGPLRRNKMYIQRPFDALLEKHLREGVYCFVSGPRQIGKTSLRQRVARVLEAEGVRCVGVELTGFTQKKSSVKQWLHGLCRRIARQLGLDDPADFFKRHELLGSLDIWHEYMGHVLDQVEGRIVIFLDELEFIFRAPIESEEFFGSIREMNTRRPQDSRYERLTFCLVGCTTPNDIMPDGSTTPFNIGKHIALRDFSREEVQEFSVLFDGLDVDADRVLDDLYGWTGGHPYMTQKSCVKTLKLAGRELDVKELVDSAVHEAFFSPEGRDEQVLIYAENRLKVRDDNEVRTQELLELYEDLLEGQRVEFQGNDRVQSELILSGLAAPRRVEDGTKVLQTRNRIFTTVYNTAWIARMRKNHYLVDTVRRWQSTGKRGDHLLEGKQLQMALDWADGTRRISRDELEFLLASVRTAHAVEADEREHKEAQFDREREELKATIDKMDKRSTWTTGLFVAGLLVAGLIATTFFLDLRESEQAEREASLENATLKTRLEEEERDDQEQLNQRVKTSLATAINVATQTASLANEYERNAARPLKVVIKENELLQKRQKTLEARFADLQFDVRRSTKALAELEREKSNLEDRLSGTQNRLTAAENETQSLKQTVNQREDELDRLERAKADAEKRERGIRADLQEVRQKLNEEINKRNEKSAALEELRRQHRAQTDELEQTKARLSETKATLEHSRKEVEELQRRVKQYTAEKSQGETR